ncbi:MAG TPA: hypothetical protein VFO11_13535 [Candidatus Polarisedimenticolaceae bacterium]|nr:hypothetical protein [Candidatus Polarisedimenticolaceae bacterium]
MTSRLVRVCFAVSLCAIFAAAGAQLAAKPPGGGGGGGSTGCPSGRFCVCAQIYCPVTCAGGCRYVNPCVADCAGATGCTIDAGTCGIEVP